MVAIQRRVSLGKNLHLLLQKWEFPYLEMETGGTSFEKTINNTLHTRSRSLYLLDYVTLD